MTRQLPYILLATLMLFSCSLKQEEKAQRSMYYWRTVFSLSKEEYGFLHDRDVKRLYIRYFDVVLNDNGEPMPNATLKMREEGLGIKDVANEGIEIVPTVYIMNDCMAQRHDGIAEKLLRRVMQMNETHSIKGVKEIQIDCDWTMKTRAVFFSFLEELRQKAAMEGISLSATIRLHQLSQPVPPVDRGVLMVYNTGDVTRLDCHHPILDLKDFEKYLPNLKEYDLQLSAAYPLFTWKVLYRRGKFVGIIHSDDELPVLPTDSIAVRQPDMAHIMEAKRAIGKLRPDAHSEIILYDLSKQNITRLNKNDYETIFSR